MENGVHDVRTLLTELWRIIVNTSHKYLPDQLCSKINALKGFLPDKNIDFLLAHEKPASHDVFRMDYLLRVIFKNEVRQAIDLLYQFDALISVVQSIEKYHLHFLDIQNQPCRCSSW